MKTQFKQVNIHYEISGSGKAVVLLHGFLENRHIWKEFIPEIAKNHQIIAIDLLGHGKTGCIGYVHSMEAMAEAVYTVFEKEKIESATFIGHSMGGYVSLAFLDKYPQYVRSLYLMNSTPAADSPERRENRNRAISLVKRNPEAFIKMSLNNLLPPENKLKFQKELDFLTSEALKLPIQGIIAALEGMKLRKDRTELLRFSKKKKFLIAGKKDPILNFETVKNTAKYCQCELLQLSGGHLSFIENKDQLLQLVHFID